MVLLFRYGIPGKFCVSREKSVVGDSASPPPPSLLFRLVYLLRDVHIC